MPQLVQDIYIGWGHCDPAKVVFNPRYFEWVDAAAMRLFLETVPDIHSSAESTGFAGIPLVSNECKFRAPARFNDTLQLVSEITQVGAAKITLRHRFNRNEELLVECSETRVWTVRDPDSAGQFKAAAIPDDIRKALPANT